MEKLNGVSIERVGSGERLLLIHGTGGTRFHWTPVVGPLAEQRELLLVDLPGHGKSDPLPVGVPHTPIGYAAILADTLDELGTPLPDVAGNSVGGWTALELAKLGHARSVVAIGPAGPWANQDPWQRTVKLWTQHKLGRAFARITPRVMRSDLGRRWRWAAPSLNRRACPPRRQSRSPLLRDDPNLRRPLRRDA
jgi:pimeloyl-ACP methyl ester carboxylesterase